MGRFGEGLFNFMKGRYGFDQLGRALSVYVAVVWIISIIVGVFVNVFGRPAAIISMVLNWIGLALLLIMVFRMLSRNVTKRRAENEAFLRRRQKKAERKHGAPSNSSTSTPVNEEPGYVYLDCSFCGQRMRVPTGKGKVAVKCPSCGEKTIVNS